MRKLSRLSFGVAGLVLIAGLFMSAAMAQPTRPPTRIGVVDLDRLVRESPQAQKARQNMAERFGQRKNALEQASDQLQAEIDRLKEHSETMSDDQREQLSSRIRDDKNELQLKQSQYNNDVSDAEQKELKDMRSDLRQVIDDYAKQHGYDLIVGDSVLYANDTVDITDAILDRLKQQPGANDKDAPEQTGTDDGG